MTLLDRLLSPERRRRRALARVGEGPLHDYLATPFPPRDADCDAVEIVALDFETTGLDPRRDRILSIGMVSIRHLVIHLGSAWHQIVQVDEAIPEDAAIIHEITDDRSATGRPLEEVMPTLLRRLAGRVLLAHYAKIEQRFLDAACRRLYGGPFVIPTIDTLHLAHRIFERRNHSIQVGDLRLFNLRPRYNLPRYKAHNALSDALSTAELFLALVMDISPRPPRPLRQFLTRP